MSQQLPLCRPRVVPLALLALSAAAMAGAVPTSGVIRVSKDTASLQAGIRYSTIQGAIDSISTDTLESVVILVSPGDYAESLTLSQSRVNIVGVEAGAVRIVPPSGAALTIAADADAASLINSLEALEFVGNSSSPPIEIQGANFSNATNLVFRNCVAESSVGPAVAMSGGPVLGCLFDDCVLTGQKVVMAGSGDEEGSQIEVRDGELHVSATTGIGLFDLGVDPVLPAFNLFADVHASRTRFTSKISGTWVRTPTIRVGTSTLTSLTLEDVHLDAGYTHLTTDGAPDVYAAESTADAAGFDWGPASFQPLAVGVLRADSLVGPQGNALALPAVPGTLAASATAPLALSTNGVLSLNQASATQPGYLSAADWAAFAAKEPVLLADGNASSYMKGDKSFGNFESSARAAFSATAPVSLSTSGVVSLPQATSGQNGYLSSTDWSTFNSKEPAISTDGSTAKYLRGNKTFADFNTAARGAISATSPLTYNSGTGALGLTTPLPASNGGTGVTGATSNYVFAGPNGYYAAPGFRQLVDADIPDALTTTGGSINNTPIGGTTPNTGAFTTLTATTGNVTTVNATTASAGTVTASTNLISNSQRWVGLSQASATFDATISRNWDNDKGWKIGITNPTGGSSGFVYYPVELRPGDVITTVKVSFAASGSYYYNPGCSCVLPSTSIEADIFTHHDWSTSNGNSVGTYSYWGPVFTSTAGSTTFYASTGTFYPGNYTVDGNASVVLRLLLDVRSTIPALYVTGVSVLVTHREL